MKENDVLYFEDDDTSELSANGKQVFLAKRINGKISRNKVDKTNNEKKGKKLKNEKEEKLADNEIIIGIDKIYFPEEQETESNKRNRKTNSKTTKNKNKKAKKQKAKAERKKSNSKSSSKLDSTDTSNKSIKKKKRRKRIIKILILLTIIIGTVVFALVSPIFNIETITVTGNNKISEQTIISLSQLKTGENIFKNLKSEIIANIKEESYIDTVEIKRILPGTIEITVEERTVAYQIQVIDSYVYIDYQGYILEKSSEEEDVPILTGMTTSQSELLSQDRLTSDDITKLNVILKIVENAKKLEIYDLITEIDTENNEYILYLESEEKYIYLGDGSDIANKMMYAQIIIENEKGNSGKAMINGNLDDGFNPYFSEEEI